MRAPARALLSRSLVPRVSFAGNRPKCHSSNLSRLPSRLRSTVSESADYQPYVRSLLLAWLAYQHQSLLGAKCLVETVLETYRSKTSLQALQLELAFLRLQQQDEAVQQLQPLDSELLLSFISVIYLVCEDVGCPLHPAAMAAATPAARPEEPADAQLKGLQQYVRQTLQQYANGVTLAQAMHQQEMAAQSVGAAGGFGSNPHVVLMQNLTRIALLTIEVLQRRGLCAPRGQLIPQLRSSLGMAPAPLPADVNAARVELQITAFADHLNPSTAAELTSEALLSCKGSLSQQQVRWLAIQLLIEFMGATMGWAMSFQAFVETAFLAYLSGATATDIYAALDSSEFELAGQLLRSRPESSVITEMNAEAFRRWLSTSYATWALSGVPHAQAGTSDTYGWAWPPNAQQNEDAVLEVYAHYNFVSSALERIRGTSPALAARFMADVDTFNSYDQEDLVNQLAQYRQEAISKRIQDGVVGAKIEDPNLLKGSSAATFMLQQLGIIELARDLVVRLSQQPSAALE